MAITLYTVWGGSVSIFDAFIWGLIGIITQVLVYLIIEYVLTPKTSLAKKVEEGNLAVGLVVAGSLTY